jgi:hypothetical protein
MRLEEEAPEETLIRDLENKIDQARGEGASVDSLIEERRRVYEAWIERLDRELEGAKGDRDRERIEKQRERAIRDYE